MREAGLRVDVELDEPELTVRWNLAGDHQIRIGLGPTPDPGTHTDRLRVPASERVARLTDVPPDRPYVSLSYDGTVVVAADRRVPAPPGADFLGLPGYPPAARGWVARGRGH